MADLTRSVPVARPRLGITSFALPRVSWGVVLIGATILYIVIPMVAVLLYGVATRWTDHILPDGYTFDHWRAALADGRFRTVTLRSFGLAAAAALLDLVLVTPAAYWQRVRNPRIRPVIELLAAIPFSIPIAVIAFGLLTLSGRYTPSLQGTLTLILPAHAAVAFSFVYWAVDGSMAAADVARLSEAARTCGAGPGTILLRVILPNIGPGLASGAILAFGFSFNELSLVQILAGDRFETVPLYMLNLLKSTDADFNLLAVMTAVTFALTLALSIAVVLFNRDGSATGAIERKGAPAR